MIRNSRRMVALAVAGAVAIAPVISGCGAGRTPQSAVPSRLTPGVDVSIPRDKAENAQINLRHMFLLGPKPGEPVAPGTSLALYGVLINQVTGRQDRLVSVSSPLFESARIDGGGIVLPPAAPDGTGSLTKLLGEVTAGPSPTAPGQSTRPGTRQPGQRTETATPAPTGPGATTDPTSGPTSGNTTGPAQSGPPQITGEAQPRVVLTGLNKELFAGALVTVRMQFEQAGAVEFGVPLVTQQQAYNTYPLVTPTGQAPGSPGATGGPQQSPGTQSPGTQSPGTEPTQPGTAPSGAESPGAAGGH